MGFYARGRAAHSALIVAAGLAAVVTGAVLGSVERAPRFEAAPIAGTTTPGSTINVHVAGWVVSPGVVHLQEGSIVADAIDAAGGLKPGASSQVVNLAAPLRSGDQVLIPGPGAAGTRSADDGTVDLNRASASDLEQLPGVGPVLAERIVAHRESHGPFDQVEDLLDVPGIGESKLASMRDLIRAP